MRTLSQRELLGAWEAALANVPAARAIDLLRAADEPVPERLPVGRRDALLIDLREQLFGSRLSAMVNCPGCGEQQEFEIQARDVRVAAVNDADDLSVTCADVTVTFRLPDTRDVLAAARGTDAAGARNILLERCVLAAQAGDRDIAACDLPAEVVDAISRRMAEADPQAETELSFQCAACRHIWTAVFDIASFLWSEIHAWAARTLHEIHQLAAAYGWSEGESLSVSPWRRSRYLEMIAG